MIFYTCVVIIIIHVIIKIIVKQSCILFTERRGEFRALMKLSLSICAFVKLTFTTLCRRNFLFFPLFI